MLSLIEQYNLQAFELNVLAVERTLAEKILFLVKKSHEEDPVSKLSTGIRHLYDINKILKQDRLRNIVCTPEFPRLIEECVAQEASCFEKKEWHDLPLKCAPIFENFNKWAPSLERAYYGEFKNLVCGDLPEFSQVKNSIKFIHDSLNLT